jgi:hypothetical protein
MSLLTCFLALVVAPSLLDSVLANTWTVSSAWTRTRFDPQRVLCL